MEEKLIKDTQASIDSRAKTKAIRDNSIAIDNNSNVVREKTITLVSAIVMFLVAILALAGSWDTNRKLTNYVSCQVEWNTFLHTALNARTNAGAEATLAMDELINTVSQSTSPDESRAALAKYKEARAKQIKTQQEHPLPPAPEQVCEL